MSEASARRGSGLSGQQAVPPWETGTPAMTSTILATQLGWGWGCQGDTANQALGARGHYCYFAEKFPFVGAGLGASGSCPWNEFNSPQLV